MCGIIGIFNYPQACKEAKKALELLSSRGQDGVGLSNFNKVIHAKTVSKLASLSGKNIIGHTLHAVVSEVPQPLKNIKNKEKSSGVLAVNGEIYNWQELAKKHNFTARNDSEMLLQFLDNFWLEKGSLDKLNDLDGVYALAYCKKTIVNEKDSTTKNTQTVTLIRDLLGEKPL